MAAGRLVAEGSPGEIKSRQTGHLLEFTVDQPQRAADLLKPGRDRWRVSLFGTRLHVITDDEVATAQRALTRELEDHGVRVLEVREASFSLEDVFIAVVEQARARGQAVVRR
jgi:ABC-2 type transport system ATP-binding protein